ncbi:MAG: calcium/sodium antiporter [Epsilonproteobacteria bacterium]|nr:calcium/sodium antiporter [Campylobacterota bacterium]
MEYIIFVVSLASLIYGADFIINESERIALHFNISSFVIGASLVAFGTSLPEMAASMTASYFHKSDMAVANVIGSVIFNISLVLGLVFLIAKKISPKRDLFQKDSAWGLFPVLIFTVMISDGVISRFEGFAFLFVMVAYLVFLTNDAKELTDEIDEELKKEKFNWIKSISLLVVGFVLVIVGAKYTIQSASFIARSMGVSEWVISLLLIAFGTSLPELVVSVKAARKGNADMAIGNIIGSNVANFTMVLGGAAIINPLTINLSNSIFDIVSVLVVSVMLVFITANKLYSKSAGIVLLVMIALVINQSITH